MNLKLIFVAGILLASCEVPGAKKDSNGTSITTFKVGYESLERDENNFKRIFQLQGNSIRQQLVDRQIEGEFNWKEVGLTDSHGRFVDAEVIEKKVRYRFGGNIETQWFEKARVVRLTSGMTLPDKISAYHCYLDPGVTIYLRKRNIEFDCHYIRIEGKIAAFPGGASHSKQGESSGNLKLKADRVDVLGHVELRGQDGFTQYGNGVNNQIVASSGTHAGNGGILSIYSNQLYENPNAYNVDGGKAAGRISGTQTFAKAGHPGRILKYSLSGQLLNNN